MLCLSAREPYAVFRCIGGIFLNKYLRIGGPEMMTTNTTVTRHHSFRGARGQAPTWKRAYIPCQWSNVRWLYIELPVPLSPYTADCFPDNFHFQLI